MMSLTSGCIQVQDKFDMPRLLLHMGVFAKYSSQLLKASTPF